MSMQENINGGLVLAASPMAKKLLGITNVMRQRDLPKDRRLVIANPRMNLYIEENLIINQIYRDYTTENKVLPYSIDESILDMTETWAFFGASPELVARQIQERVRRETEIYLSVGIGDSPVLAKLALDLEAKKPKA